MKKNVTFVVCLAFLLSFSHETWASIGDIANQRLGDMASPVNTPAKNYLIWGSALTATLFLLRSEISEPLARKTAAHPPLSHSLERLGYHFGEIYPNAAYTGIMLIGAAFGMDRALTRADIMASATVYSGLWETILKEPTKEERPNKYDKKAFPSGHTTVAFAFASVVAAEHPWYLGVPAYALASLTGYSRINDNAHWLHDVVFGATLGISYGLGMHYRRPENSSTAENDERRWRFQVLPLEGTGAGFFAGTKF